MRIICAIAGHKRGRRVLKNRSTAFARCSRCRCDLVRRKGGTWKEPAGYRIRWPAGLAEEAAQPRSAPDRGAIRLGDRSTGAANRPKPAANTVTQPIDPAAGRQDIARISVYRPGPDEPDFMANDEDDLFWDVPIAVHASFLRKVPKLSELEVARLRRRRRR